MKDGPKGSFFKTKLKVACLLLTLAFVHSTRVVLSLQTLKFDE